MKPKMWPREAQESFLGGISSLEISRSSPRCGQERLKRAFLMKSPAYRFQDEGQDGAKRGSRKVSG